jgi:hypothetical protein
MLAVGVAENGLEELIGWKSSGQAHGQIVFRERRRELRNADRIAAEGEDAEGAAEL